MLRRFSFLFRKLPFLLVLVILGTVFLEPFLPLVMKQAVYAMALSITMGILFVLPFIIFCLLLKAMIVLSKKATAVILLVLVLVCVSNFLSTFLAHFVGGWIYHFNFSLLVPPEESHVLIPLWSFTLPKLVNNSQALLAGILLGLLLGQFVPHSKAMTLAKKIELGVTYFLKIVLYLIPIFVVGFVMKLQYEGVIGTIFREYTLVFLFVALAQFSYIFLIYFLLSGCRAKEFIRLVKNMLPATISGFSTMSSAVSLPVTLIGVERNTTHKEVADAVVPTTVNIHLVGDSFAITIFAYAVLKSFGMDEPSFLTYLMFAGYFVLAKFSVAAVPGGGILVMLPILENHLGFQGAMLSMITGLFILFDSVSTAANVLGNGAFAKVVDNCMVWFKGRRKTSP